MTGRQPLRIVRAESQQATKMNRIVHDHFPVSKLPAELREGIDVKSSVQVVINFDTPVKRMTYDELTAAIEKANKNRPKVTTEEAVARIRALRDEWDE